jgi:hypothetical protein
MFFVALAYAAEIARVAVEYPDYQLPAHKRIAAYNLYARGRTN